MTTFPNRYLARVAAFVAVALVAACQSSDKIPPKGSTITVAANPATIPLASDPDCVSLLNVATCGTADVVATVASELGVPLPDQDVRFSGTAGFLFTGSPTSPVNAANIPIRTDRFGNASVNLITSTTTTVTAKSGAASGTLSISTVSGNLSTILLNNDTSSTGCSSSNTLVTSCSQTVCVVAQAVAAGSGTVSGVPIFFKLQNNVSGSNTFSVKFTPSQTTTDSSGKAFAQFTPDSTCAAQCTGGKACQGEVIATTSGGSFPSQPLLLRIVIP